MQYKKKKFKIQRFNLMPAHLKIRMIHFQLFHQELLKNWLRSTRKLYASTTFRETLLHLVTVCQSVPCFLKYPYIHKAKFTILAMNRGLRCQLMIFFFSFSLMTLSRSWSLLLLLLCYFVINHFSDLIINITLFIRRLFHSYVFLLKNSLPKEVHFKHLTIYVMIANQTDFDLGLAPYRWGRLQCYSYCILEQSSKSMQSSSPVRGPSRAVPFPNGVKLLMVLNYWWC